MSNFCKLRSWILKETSLARSSLNAELWSWYASWMRFIWLCNLRLWNIQTTGAKENWDVMKALISFLCSNSKEYAILAKAFSFWLAFLQRDLTCQFIIKMDTQELFTFTIGDSNFTNVNLNFLCWVRKNWFFFGLSENY